MMKYIHKSWKFSSGLRDAPDFYRFPVEHMFKIHQVEIYTTVTSVKPYYFQCRFSFTMGVHEILNDF